MKSFNIFVDRRLVQSDLIVVNLPVRNDIAAYYRLNLDSRLISHMIAEKAASPVDNVGGIAFDAKADGVVAKREIVGTCPIVLDANAEFKASFSLDYEKANSNTVLDSDVQSLSHLLHMEHIQSNIGIGVDPVDLDPQRSLGKLLVQTSIGAEAPLVVAFLVDAENSVKLTCIASAALRRMRMLADIDALGTLADIDDMTLEDMYYVYEG